MNPPRVVKKGEEAYDEYIGRGSRFGNKFIIGIHGDREECIKQYEEWIRTQPELMAAIPELEGKVLACFCKPKNCHGDVLVKLFEELKQLK